MLSHGFRPPIFDVDNADSITPNSSPDMWVHRVAALLGSCCGARAVRINLVHHDANECSIRDMWHIRVVLDGMCS